jgi:hypothetical protein
MKRVEELTLKWIDGDMLPDEADELDRLLAGDPLARRVHVECCDLEAALRSRWNEFDVSEATLARIHDFNRNRKAMTIAGDQSSPDNDGVLFELPPEWLSLDDLTRRLQRRRRVRQFTLALSLLLAVGLGAFFYWGTPLEIADARIDHADSKVTITRNNEPLAVGSGFALRTGDIVDVPASAVASIDYDDGTRVVLGSNSQVRLEPLTRFNAASKHLALQRGQLAAHVAKQPLGKSMQIVTSTARFQVLGTRFTLAADETKARLDVIEGRVRAEQPDAKTVIEVSQGQFAVAESQTEFIARPSEPRVARSLLALYRFDEGRGAVVRDVSQVGSPLDLHVDRPAAAEWLSKGGLGLRDGAFASSTEPAKKIIDACRKSNELTVEAWVKPTLASQSGPGRLVTLSSDPSHRNFTLGHGGDPDELTGSAHRSFFIGRVRTTKTSKNGVPDLHSRNDSVVADLSHVVYTRSADGLHHLYVDGIERASEKRLGDFSTWDKNYRLAIGDEFTRDRPWQGEYFLVAIFSRAISRDEVLQNYRAGPREKRRESVTSRKTRDVL